MLYKFLDTLHLYYVIFISFLYKIALSFRYKTITKGLDKITEADLNNKPVGILYLPNHTSLIDAPRLASILYPYFRKFVRPVTVYPYYDHPSFIPRHTVRIAKPVPVPDFGAGVSDVTKEALEQTIKRTAEGLKNGENFMFYPSGRLKLTGYENLAGNSGLYEILKRVPNAHIVLVRLSGLWGSKLSVGWNGDVPNPDTVLKEGFWIVMKNLLFFTPRRRILLEFEIAQDFPYQGTKHEINQYLENWYNLPYKDLSPKEEPRKYVPYYFWKRKTEFPFSYKPHSKNIKELPNEIINDITAKLEAISGVSAKKINLKTLLGTDLDLDSLDLCNLIAYMERKYDLSMSSWEDLYTVEDFAALAAKAIPAIRAQCLPKIIDEKVARDFLNSHKGYTADRETFPLSHNDIKSRAISLSRSLTKLPDQEIGVMLDQSIEGLITILAILHAQKTAVIFNWTMDASVFDQFIDQNKMFHVVTSRRFWMHINNINIGKIQKNFIFLEDLNTYKILGFGSLNIGNSVNFIQLDNNSNLIPISTKFNDLISQFNDLKLSKNQLILNTLPIYNIEGFCLGSLIPFLSNNSTVLFSTYRTNNEDIIKGITNWNPEIIIGNAPLFPLVATAKQNQQLPLLYSYIEIEGNELKRRIL